jgi:hypothetical protein
MANPIKPLVDAVDDARDAFSLARLALRAATKKLQRAADADPEAATEAGAAKFLVKREFKGRRPGQAAPAQAELPAAAPVATVTELPAAAPKAPRK